MEFSSAELDFLCEQLGVDELPYPFDVHSQGATMNERAALRTQVLGGLFERGLVDGAGRPEPRLEDAFAVLRSAELSLDAVHIAEPAGTVSSAMAATLGGQGLLAVQEAGGLRLREVPTDGLASAIVELLPGLRRGTEKSVTVELRELMSGHGVDFMQRRPSPDGAERTGADEDRKTLARLHAQPRQRGGQLGANARSDGGPRTRGPVLSWFDTESGCYFTQASKGQDGRDWITIAPVDAPTLRNRLNEMLSGAVRSREGLG